MPWKIQRYIWTHCYASAGAIQTFKACDSPVSEAEALAALTEMRRAPELTAELRFWMVNVYSGLDLMRDIQADARTLAADVLKERGAP